MKIKKFLFLILAIFITSCNNQYGDLNLPSVFSDHMVLQQKSNVSFWGESNLNDKITISASWGETLSTKADNNGKWQLSLATPKAGGPYSIEVKNERQSIVFNDVLIGEVWLASGQSNMGMILSDGIENQEEEIKNANFNDIRFFSVLEDLTGESIKQQKWVKTNPKNAAKFSAAAYFFARELHEKLNIPIGIISSSWGGTYIENWISNKKLKTLTSTKNKVPKSEEDDLVQFERLRYNDSIAKLNEMQFALKTFDLPKPYFLWNEKIVWNVDLWKKFKKDWEVLDLNDIEFKKIEFDDSNWGNIKKITEKDKSKIKDGVFNYIFKSNNSFLSTGVIWLRAKIKIDDVSRDYYLNIDKGINRVDQTFFNEKLIGNTFSIDGKRSYKIPKEILKRGKNLIALRVTNIQGDGGFRSPVILKNNVFSKEINLSQFKFKHHAFLTNGSSVMVHDYSYKQLLDNYIDIEKKIHRGYVTNSPYGNSISFEKMLKPVIPYTIKGVIWYQGEQNVPEYKEYKELFSGMIDDWRENWGYDFPFYYAQITPHIYSESQPSHKLRDVQRLAIKSTFNTGMASLLDVGLENNNHSPKKQPVGKRLALLALDNDYNFDIVSSGPLYVSHKIFNDYLEIDFDHKGSGLSTSGKLEDFEIAGENKIFYPALAQIVNNKVRVFSNLNVKYPKHVRYGWKNWVIGTLFNEEGLPASSFNSLSEY